jgi:hypothetical protein
MKITEPSGKPSGYQTSFWLGGRGGGEGGRGQGLRAKVEFSDSVRFGSDPELTFNGSADRVCSIHLSIELHKPGALFSIKVFYKKYRTY